MLKVDDNGEIASEIVDRFSNINYHDEPLGSRSVDQNLPQKLKVARAFAESYTGRRLSREQLFFKQAQMLANYEDEFDYSKDITRYYPTYQSLSNKELRAYFSWRTKWRKGHKRKTSLSFAFIYVYELLHLVGCADTGNAYLKLTEFNRDYSYFDPYIKTYLKDWIRDFVIYYGLDPSLLADTEDIRWDNAVSVLLKIHNESDENVFQAAAELSGSLLKGSLLLKKHPDIMKFVVVGTLRQVASHYATKCRNTWIEHYFGYPWKRRIWFFEKAIFSNHKSHGDCEIEISPIRRCYCVEGQWFSQEFRYVPEYRKRFLNLLKTIDSLTRDAIRFPHPIQQKLTTKWIICAIKEEIRRWETIKKSKKEEKKEEIHIDLSKLGEIRSDSAVTREKLLTEDEIEGNSIVQAKMESDSIVLNSNSSEPDPSNDNLGFNLLSPQEKRYLRCLLDGESVSWVSSEGLLPSLLCDSINDKLYCLFEDTVLEDGLLIEDYTEELKKGLCS